jgi:hypothetical protein
VSSGSQILVLSGDPMFAALLGMFAELAGHSPAFAQPGERPEEALARVRPLFVVLIDAELDAARTDIFLAAAARRRVGVALIRTRVTDASVPRQPVARDVPSFEVPTDFDQFRAMLRATADCKWWLGGGDRRQVEKGAIDDVANAAAVYVDASGRRWQVIDRRGAERRLADRLFVAEDGEMRRCELASGEEGDMLPEQLERQLARATRP